MKIWEALFSQHIIACQAARVKRGMRKGKRPRRLPSGPGAPPLPGNPGPFLDAHPERGSGEGKDRGRGGRERRLDTANSGEAPGGGASAARVSREGVKTVNGKELDTPGAVVMGRAFSPIVVCDRLREATEGYWLVRQRRGRRGTRGGRFFEFKSWAPGAQMVSD